MMRIYLATLSRPFTRISITAIILACLRKNNCHKPKTFNKRLIRANSFYLLFYRVVVTQVTVMCVSNNHFFNLFFNKLFCTCNFYQFQWILELQFCRQPNLHFQTTKYMRKRLSAASSALSRYRTDAEFD